MVRPCRVHNQSRLLGLSVVIVTFALTPFLCSVSFAESTQDMNNRGIDYLNAGDYKKARECLESAYTLAPDNKTIKKNLVNTYVSLASQYAQENHWSEAMHFGEKAYILDKTNTEAINNLSTIYNNYGCQMLGTGDFEKAYSSFIRALKLNNENWTIYVNVGNLMYQQGKFAEAVNYWQKAVALHPDLPDIRTKIDDLEKENKIGEKFNRKEYAHFEVKYEGYSRQDLANLVLEILDTAYYRLGSDFSCYPKEKVTVIIYTQSQFREVTDNPDWLPAQSEGVGIIRVTADDLEQNKERIKDVLYHEYTHLLLYRRIGNNIPRWLNEGLSQYKEPGNGDKLSPSELVVLKRHLADKTLIPLGDLDAVWDKTRDVDIVKLAYLEAKLLVLYIVDRYNFYQVLQILDKFKESKNINKALKDALYLDTAQFEQRWHEWLQERY